MRSLLLILAACVTVVTASAKHLNFKVYSEDGKTVQYDLNITVKADGKENFIRSVEERNFFRLTKPNDGVATEKDTFERIQRWYGIEIKVSLSPNGIVHMTAERRILLDNITSPDGKTTVPRERIYSVETSYKPTDTENTLLLSQPSVDDATGIKITCRASD